jgi:hypothetical protein
MSLYPVFADWAKRHGVEAAMERFTPSLGDSETSAYRRQFDDDLAKVQAGGPPIISAGGEDWYSGPGEDDHHWPRLAEYFESEGWAPTRIDDVHKASDTVVAHTPRPSPPAWDSKGLVVGYVQSGKTTNFTAVIAKMADVDYRLVIVLSGIHNGLRRQTQARLDQQLKMLNPSRWMTLTDETRDFQTQTYTADAPLSSNKTVLIVAKKNATVLERLIEWLEGAASTPALQGAACLVIDDEADQASVATGRINPLIRKLLSLMPRRTYIGYTATPFANVFIDPTQDDLYPKSFILNLPRPVGYFGPEMIFGRDAVEGEDTDAAPDGYDMVRVVPDARVPSLRPVGRQQVGAFTPHLVDELREAIHWFWLATAARRARGDTGHSTMLIHTSVKIEVHEAFKPLLDEYRSSVLDRWIGGDAELRETLEHLWKAESEKVPAGDWNRVQDAFEDLAPHFQGVLEETRIVLDNYRSQDRLVYSDDEPVVAVAVGGNTLSRGLTLEGLVVSFFVRAATAYDTLLQMGRWFGFRTGFEDLPRIWMTGSLQASFRHLAIVEHEMRSDIDRYQRENLKPTDVAVRIRTHPVLRITAKMGAAQSAYISYAGRRLQTRYFRAQDPEWLGTNLRAAHVLIQDARRHGIEETRGDNVLFRDVPVGLVTSFLSEYLIHEDSPDLDPAMVTKYIDTQLRGDSPSLDIWSVALVGGTGSSVDIGGISIGSVIRSRLNDDNTDRADIKTLMSRQDRVLDLEITTGAAQAAGEAKLAKLRNDDPTYRNRGLIVLYPIDRVSQPIDPGSSRPAPARPARIELGAEEVVIGMGLVFPGEAQARNRIRATHVAVDLTDVEREDLEEALNSDTESPAT